MQRFAITAEHPVTEHPVTTVRTSQGSGHKVSKPSYSNVATQLHCPLCNESHRLFKCEAFIKLQPKQRLSQAKQLGLFQLLATIHKESHMLKATVLSMS